MLIASSKARRRETSELPVQALETIKKKMQACRLYRLLKNAPAHGHGKLTLLPNGRPAEHITN
jgi:sulfur relay (sulfurtransferase) DsrC/TusE family protein